MAFEATKRELGELYTFFRLLADGKVFPGTPDAQRDDRKYWPVALIQREEHDGTRRYYIGEEDVRIVSGTVEKDGTFTASAGKEPLSFPRADFGDAAEIILHLLRNEHISDRAHRNSPGNCAGTVAFDRRNFCYQSVVV